MEISSAVGVPRSTVIGWCIGIELSSTGKQRLEAVIKKQRDRARESSVRASHERKASRKHMAFLAASSTGPYLSTYAEKRAVLGALYLAEGTKGDRSGLTFGNSDPDIINLFLQD